MGHWEPSQGASNEWYTPPYVFEALGEHFDLDVAHPDRKTHSPCDDWFSQGSLEREWYGFVWMNPPYGGRNGLIPWLEKFFTHGQGIALVPDRTSAPWWQDAARRCSSLLLIDGKIRFLRPDGTLGVSPSNGTTLFAIGARADAALIRAQSRGLGITLKQEKSE